MVVWLYSHAWQVFFSEAQRTHFKQQFDHLLDAAAAPGGLHPKMGRNLTAIFDRVVEVGGEIGQYKRRRTSQRTWKDNTRNTMFLE